jgi:hypothetical protein
MPPRANNSITMMVAQAQQKMRELKELQFFGGDSLNLRRWTQNVTIPTDSVMHCWQVIIIPDDPTTMMPFSAIMKPANATSFIGGQVEAVHRTDGSFEYLFIFNAEFGGTPPIAKLVIEYSGTATFNVTQIG